MRTCKKGLGMLCFVLAVCASIVPSVQALGLAGIAQNGNDWGVAISPPPDLTAGLEGQPVFLTLNPIEATFRVEVSDGDSVGLQLIIENESTEAWGDFHATLSNGAFFERVGDIRPFNPAPADFTVDPSTDPTTVNIFFLPKLPCGGQFNACVGANDFDNSVGLGNLGFAGDMGVNDAEDWVINVAGITGGAAGRVFTLTLTPSLDGRAPVPEPTTLLLFGSGLAVFSLRVWRQRLCQRQRRESQRS